MPGGRWTKYNGDNKEGPTRALAASQPITTRAQGVRDCLGLKLLIGALELDPDAFTVLPYDWLLARVPERPSLTQGPAQSLQAQNTHHLERDNLSSLAQKDCPQNVKAPWRAIHICHTCTSLLSPPLSQRVSWCGRRDTMTNFRLIKLLLLVRPFVPQLP
ncbi:hypothetical protein BDV11DRAFT_111794 [Aspergillus similis]